MSFTSYVFPLFLLGSMAIYYTCAKRWQWLLLLMASLLFYCWGGAAPLAYLLFTALTVWAGALYMEKLAEETKTYLAANKSLSREEKKRAKAQGRARCRRVFLAALLCNLGILCVLKYFNFTARYAVRLFALFTGGDGAFAPVDFLVPLGLSFYTFQAVGYLIDIYNGKYAAQRNPLRFLLFVSFFPQVVQGPIGRFDQLAPQLEAAHRFDAVQVKRGAIQMLWGYMMKLVIADRLAPLVNVVYGSPDWYGSGVIVLGVLGYALQLYADFAGGIHIVTGAAQLFGIELAPNFRQPYFAASLGDFWRRWHISLGAWMRDYVFYPLAVSGPMSALGKALKKKHPQLARTLPAAVGNVIVFLLVGVWHGAKWSFIFWGLYNGLVLAISALLEPAYKAAHARMPALKTSKGWHAFCVARTFVIVCIGYYFDRATSMRSAVRMLWRTASAHYPEEFIDGTLLNLGLSLADYAILAAALGMLLAVSIAKERGVRVRAWMDTLPTWLRWAMIYALMLFVVCFASVQVTETEAFMYAAF